MKAAPVMQALAAIGLNQALVHTGQHYDAVMSGQLFDQLGLRSPDINLNVGSGTHAKQTAAVMIGLEAYLTENRPSLLLVYGDVNSTAAAALVAAKLQIPVGHVEAGLRSRDRSMPEEINRLVTDCLATLLFTPSADADANLLHEGIARDSIHRVGNVMIDSLVRCLPLANADRIFTELRIAATDPYILVTLHRPSSVDDVPLLQALLGTLAELAKKVNVVFPVHPRTRARIISNALNADKVHLIEPIGYLEFIALERNARLVITDSGGVQEETTFFGVPCLTVRDNTERPVTISHGTNQLVGRDPQRLLEAATKSLKAAATPKERPELWDGRAAERIAAVIAKAVA
jgi:UDP-N-acetylglucosamine 2-epimerase (non-hydrolysing)